MKVNVVSVEVSMAMVLLVSTVSMEETNSALPVCHPCPIVSVT